MSQPPDRTDPGTLFDPFGLWKQSQQAMLESWSKTLNEAANTPAYAETTGRMLDSYLTAAAPVRKMVDQTMTQLLNQLSLPSRAEVVSLAERMTNIELRLDDLDARLDDILRGVERTAQAAQALAALSAAANGTSVTSVNGSTPVSPGAENRRRTARATRTTTRSATASEAVADAAPRRRARTK